MIKYAWTLDIFGTPYMLRPMKSYDVEMLMWSFDYKAEMPWVKCPYIAVVRVESGMCQCRGS